MAEEEKEVSPLLAAVLENINVSNITDKLPKKKEDDPTFFKSIERIVPDDTIQNIKNIIPEDFSDKYHYYIKKFPREEYINNWGEERYRYMNGGTHNRTGYAIFCPETGRWFAFETPYKKTHSIEVDWLLVPNGAMIWESEEGIEQFMVRHSTFRKFHKRYDDPNENHTHEEVRSWVVVPVDEFHPDFHRSVALTEYMVF